MILTVTPNPALDVTYQVDELRPGAEHRVQAVHTRPGSKGVNVARVLTTLGAACGATGLAGGATGAELRAGLRRLGVHEDFLETAVDSRRTVVVTGGGLSTSLWEPGPVLPAELADRLVAAVSARLGECQALVVAGSLPPGLPADVHARLASAATSAGVPALVDADGAALREAVAVPGVVLTPNATELERLTGVPVTDAASVLSALSELPRHARADWVVTLGGSGMVAVSTTGAWAAAPPEQVHGTATGAGDAAAAALVRALAAAGGATGVDWPEALRDAVALGAAAVLSPVAGEVDLEAYARWHPRVHVRALPAPAPPRTRRRT